MLVCPANRAFVFSTAVVVLKLTRAPVSNTTKCVSPSVSTFGELPFIYNCRNRDKLSDIWRGEKREEWAMGRRAVGGVDGWSEAFFVVMNEMVQRRH